MLRGKFGQLGTNLGDGHVTMDAFQQAAFRDHIRSGERIMFLAATGRLKHKRTRDTIAAEPTPRSSCPSITVEPRVAAAAPTAGPGVGTAHVLAPRDRHERDSSRSDSIASHRVSAPSCKTLTAAGQPPTGAGGRRSSSSAISSPDMGTTSRKFQAQNVGPRARSAGPVRRRSQQPVVRTSLHGSRSDVSTTKCFSTKNPEPRARGSKSTRSLQAEGHVDSIPRNVGPMVSDTDGTGAAANTGPKSLHCDVPSRFVNRPRPASAGPLARGDLTMEARRRRSPSGIVKQGFEGEDGDGGLIQSGKSRTCATPTARLSPNGGRNPPTGEGSFALSVINSAHPLLDYCNAQHNADRRETKQKVARDAGEKLQRPRSAGASPSVAATRLISVGAIDRSSKKSRLAAVRAAELTSAAAVCAAKAEQLLRRAILSSKTGNAGARKPSGLPTTTPVARRGNAKIREREGSGNDGVGRLGSSSFARAGGGRDDGAADGKRGSRSEDGCFVGVGSGDVDGDSSKSRRRVVVRREPARASAAAPASVRDVNRKRNERHRPSAEKRESACSSTARTSTTTSCSSRDENGSVCTTSQRSASTRESVSTKSAMGRADVEERRTRLLAELEALRRRMENAEGLLLEVDNSLSSRQKQRPRTATPRTRRESPGRSNGQRASTVATAGNTSAKSSAGYGALNLGERRMCPLVVTHQANAFLDES